MLITVGRVNENDQEHIVGTFTDLCHSSLFIEALLYNDNEEEQNGSYTIHYDHEGELYLEEE